MLDSRQLRNNPEFFAEQLARRGFVFDFDQFNQLEGTRKTLQKHTEDLQAERNRLSKSAGQARARGEDIEPIRAQVTALAEQLKANEQALSQLQEKFENWLLNLPNIPHASVPNGADEHDNIEIRRWGTPREIPAPKDHLDIAGEKMAFDLAAKLTGSRFVVLEGNLARLQRALTQFMLDVHTQEHGYTEVYTPFIVHADSLRGTGQLPKFAEDLFKIEGEQPWYLIPTAEVPVTNLLRDTITPAENLPRRYVCHTPCFRAEAGSAGRDTRGMIRQHQFEKVELVQFVLPEHAEESLENLTHHAENILQKLELPYRVMALCTGDMGFSAHKTYDLEVWLPAQGRYREISSCSHFEAFQARRLMARYRGADGKPALLHTLNGSGLAVGRTLVALLENGQQPDGTIYIPEALRGYLGGVTYLGL